MLSLIKLAVQLSILFVFGVDAELLRRFEYKLSFKGPHLIAMDGTVPFWDYGGHAIASDESVRITPSLKSKKGYIWSKQKKTFENWEAEVVFRISGRGRVGADGLAIWYTEDRMVEGPVFGNQDNWKGLGLFFDSFDNDGQHNNPIIIAMTNDGTKSYDHNTDGTNQYLASCIRDFRNRPFSVRVRIEYNQRTLTVFFHNGMNSVVNKEDYELCMRVENVYLPAEGYFGVSAATGGLADDQDVFSFITHQLLSEADAKQPPADATGDKKKYEEEFDEYSQKLQKAKEDYKKEHPEMRTPEIIDDAKNFESPDIQELKMIFEGQNSIHTAIRSIHKRIDEIVGRQERTLSQLSLISQQAPPSAQQPTGQQQPPAAAAEFPIKRHEVDTLLNSLRELINQLRDLRRTTDDVLGKVSNARPQDSGASNQQQQLLQQLSIDVKGPLSNLQNDVRALLSRPVHDRQQVQCPTVEPVSCVSPVLLLIFLAVQTVVFFLYSVYRSSREAAAKKFY